MPTYAYECSKCHHHMEVLQKMSDAPLRECPECKGKLRKLIGSGSGLIFKGTGFYITDYKKKNVSTSAKDVKPTSPQAKDKK
jgi:putative FmdB family regulatory protein